MKVDTLIVGFGIAGLNYAEQLRQHNKSFIVISPLCESSSRLAAGIVNPTVLKRFNPVWKAEAFLNFALSSYKNLESLVGEKVFYDMGWNSGTQKDGVPIALIYPCLLYTSPSPRDRG